MNFQTVSTAEKLKHSPGTLIGHDAEGTSSRAQSLPGGHMTVNGQQVPRPLLQIALDYVNSPAADGRHDPGRRRGRLDGDHPDRQARPVAAEQLPSCSGSRTVRSSPASTRPGRATHPSNLTLVVAGGRRRRAAEVAVGRSQAAADFVKNYLWTHSATAVHNYETPRPDDHRRSTPGLKQIFAGHESARFFGVPNSDPHHPDVFGIAQVGTIYTGGTKIAEHGGDNPGDRDVPLLVYAPGTVRPGSSDQWVETTQVAPTILRLLGLNPNDLQAVQREGTQVLPGIDQHRGW